VGGGAPENGYSEVASILYRVNSEFLIVQWTNMHFFNRPFPMGTFQVFLHLDGPKKGDFFFKYIEMATNDRASGSLATVGIKNSKRDIPEDRYEDFIQLSYRTAGSVYEGLVHYFTPNGSCGYTHSVLTPADVRDVRLVFAGNRPPLLQEVRDFIQEWDNRKWGGCCLLERGEGMGSRTRPPLCKPVTPPGGGGGFLSTSGVYFP
jgi:hypothetical protein